jgi:hypothetical protein
VDPGRSSALLIRVWLDDGSTMFRARLFSLADPESDAPHESLAVAANPDDVLAAVRRWLEAFLSGGAADGGAG